MKQDLRVFPNGLRLLINKNDNNLSCVLVRILAGVEHEKKKEEGMTSLVEKLLTFGTSSYPSRKSLQSHIDSFGGLLSTSAYLDSIELAMLSASDKAKSAIETLGEMVFESQMRVVDLNVAKKIQINDLEEQPKNAQLMCHDELRSLIFDGTGLAKNIFGRKSALEKITPEDVREYWTGVLNPKNVIVVVSGNVNEAQVYEAVLHSFYGKFLSKSGKMLSSSQELAVSPKEEQYRSSMVAKKLNQTRLNLGYRIDGTRVGNRNLVLFLSQLIDKKLEEVFSSLEAAYLYNCRVRLFTNTGLLGLEIACDDEQTENCLKACAGMFVELIENGWTNADFVSEREIYKSKYLLYLDSSKNSCKMAARVLAQTDKQFDSGAELAEIDKITQGDCLKLLKNILAQKPCLAVVGKKQDATKLLQIYEKKLQ